MRTGKLTNRTQVMLYIFDTSDGATTGDIQNVLSCTVQNASKVLKELYILGKLFRKMEKKSRGRPNFRYFLTKKGIVECENLHKRGILNE